MRHTSFAGFFLYRKSELNACRSFFLKWHFAAGKSLFWQGLQDFAKMGTQPKALPQLRNMELKENRKNTRCSRRTFKEKGYMGSSVRDYTVSILKAASLYAHPPVRRNSEWICFGIAREFWWTSESEKYGSCPLKEKLNRYDRHLSVVLLKTVMLPTSFKRMEAPWRQVAAGV